ncbi:unnamed protein product [Brassica napus]|uniref:(rape) hypothetical protein n=1 Tax=Brassica napus TaxID=3708 RepID=A0A816SF90_BRANA|nr:unnamed protein product [Brassica napus]
MAPRLDSLLHTQTQQHWSRNNVFSLQTNDVDKIIHRLITQLEYFETILRPYLTVDATESLKSVKGAVLEKALESIIETFKNYREGINGNQHALTQQCSNEMLQFELEKTRLNSACFVETSPLDSISPVAKFAYSSSRASMDSPIRTRPRRK